MKRKRFSTEQIIRILNEAQLGITVKDLCRKYGISEQSLYNWRSKYGDMDINDARKLGALEVEKQQLKRLVADLSLDNQILKELLGKNSSRPKRSGKPSDNAFAESFIRKLRNECLSEHWFLNLAHAQQEIEAWRETYNTERPHSSLNNLTPYEFIKEQAIPLQDEGFNLKLA